MIVNWAKVFRIAPPRLPKFPESVLFVIVNRPSFSMLPHNWLPETACTGLARYLAEMFRIPPGPCNWAGRRGQGLSQASTWKILLLMIFIGAPVRCPQGTTRFAARNRAAGECHVAGVPDAAPWSAGKSAEPIRNRQPIERLTRKSIRKMPNVTAFASLFTFRVAQLQLLIVRFRSHSKLAAGQRDAKVKTCELIKVAGCFSPTKWPNKCPSRSSARLVTVHVRGRAPAWLLPERGQRESCLEDSLPLLFIGRISCHRV